MRIASAPAMPFDGYYRGVSREVSDSGSAVAIRVLSRLRVL
jgi:hypothetical protein